MSHQEACKPHPRTQTARARVTLTRTTSAAAALALVGLGLTACGNGSPDGADPSQISPAAPTMTITPSTATSRPQSERDEAIAQATKAILALRQTTVDIYSSDQPDLDALHEVATGKFLEQELKEIQQNLAAGWRSDGGRVEVVWAKPVKVDLSGKKRSLIVNACVDATSISGTGPSGEKLAGARESLDYWLVPLRVGAADRWFVANMTPHAGAKGPTPC